MPSGREWIWSNTYGSATSRTGGTGWRWREIRRHLGLLRGLLGYVVIRNWFMRPSDGARPGRAEIGFVATEPAYQGRGVATALLRHLLALPGCREYTLEDIKDTNAPALHVYAKLGFTVYERRKVRFARRVGFTELVSMKLVQDPASWTGLIPPGT